MKQWSRYFLPVAFFCCMAGCATGSVSSNIQKQEQASAFRQLGEAYLGEQKRFSAVGAAAKRVLPRTIGSLWSLIRKRPI